MITGRVNAYYEALIPIHLQDVKGNIHKFEAILDTGFNGTLTLPFELITMLQFPWRTRGSAVLANGSVETFDIYVATIVWDGMPRSILVEAVDVTPLVGMRLLEGYDVRLTVHPGGIIQIVPSGEIGDNDLS